ncbi:MAG: hypothetical protein J0L65_16850 [Xanthomonadales bacterium]|nr:hypothetical protein [Xanthomonadales bacterium]
MSIRATLLSLIFVSAAHAQTTPPDLLDDPLLPSAGTPVSTADDFYVLYDDLCGRPPIDPATPVRQFQEDGVLVVEWVLLPVPEDEICFSPPIPTPRKAFRIGPLSKGLHQIERRLMLRANDGSTSLLHHSLHTVQVGETPHPALSGAWYDANNPGTGLFISLLPRTAADHNQEPLVVVYWADEDESRQPIWYTSAGRFRDGVLDIDLIKGGATGEIRPMRFSYRGCGQAHWVDPRFPTFFTELTQLTEVSGVESCAPERLNAVVIPQ